MTTPAPTPTPAPIAVVFVPCSLSSSVVSCWRLGAVVAGIVADADETAWLKEVDRGVVDGVLELSVIPLLIVLAGGVDGVDVVDVVGVVGVVDVVDIVGVVGVTFKASSRIQN